jgi:hypothetical protein
MHGILAAQGFRPQSSRLRGGHERVTRSPVAHRAGHERASARTEVVTTDAR